MLLQGILIIINPTHVYNVCKWNAINIINTIQIINVRLASQITNENR